MRRVVFFFLTLFIVNFVYARTSTKTEEVKVDNLYYKLVTITEINDWVVTSRTRGVKPITDESDNAKRYALVISGEERYSGNITIPSFVQYGGKNYPVEGIGHAAFKNCVKLIKVTIPEGCDEIGDSAFYNCALLAIVSLATESNSARTRGSVSFASPFIGKSAFEGCVNLQSVRLSGNIKETYDRAFANCISIKSVSFTDADASVRINTTGNNIGEGRYFGKEIFAGCTGIETVYAHRYVSPISDDTFDEKVYSNAQLICPEGDKEILKEMTGWKNFFNIIASLPIDENSSDVSDSEISYNFNANDKTAEVIGITEGYTGAVIIPSNVIHDGETYTVTKIGAWAFDNCIDLTSVTIPNSVTTIGNYAFKSCTGLTSITIPNSVTSIGRLVFSRCNSLTSIRVEDGNKIYDSRYNCNAIIETSSNTLVTACKNTTIPNNVTSIGNYAFYYCTGLTSITIPNSVTSIGNYAFSDSGLKSIIIPNSVISIGDSPFSGCRDLTSIKVEDGNKIFDSRYDCNAIIETSSNTLVTACKNTIIPNSVTSIGRIAFFGCHNLTTITIPNSVTSIGEDAFNACSELTSITIPNSVTSIGRPVFAACNSLTSIRVEDGNNVFDSRNNCNAIIETSSNTLVAACKNTIIPNNVTSIGSDAFNSCYSLTSITIPNSVTSICEYAFLACTGLTSITIPNSIRTIGENAFAECDGLTSVTSLISTPISLNENTFSNYNIPLYVPSESVEAYSALKPWNKFKEIIPIYLTPIENVVDYSGESSTVDENTDLCGTVIDNVYYNISSDNGGFDADEKCLVVNKAMSDEEIEEVFGKDLFSDEVKKTYTGIVIMAPAGKGKVAINAQTTGGMTLMVKVGAAEPIEMELDGKLKMKFPYDVTEPTYVYIYAGQNVASRTRASEEPSLRIYGISLEKEILKGDVNGNGVVDDVDAKDVANHIMGMTPKEFNKDAADVNNDNKVNAADIVLINKIINKKMIIKH